MNEQQIKIEIENVFKRVKSLSKRPNSTDFVLRASCVYFVGTDCYVGIGILSDTIQVKPEDLFPILKKRELYCRPNTTIIYF